MREIKFRGKRIDNSNWIYGDLLQGSEICDIYEISDCNTIDGSRYEIDRKTVGQYTGLKDKKGKKIYEGDIVKADIDKAIVEYSENDSGFILKPIGDYYFDSPMLAHSIKYLDLEVIRKYL